MHHLSWRANRDRFDVALAANRLATRGVPIWRCTLGREGVEAGDYLADLPPAVESACREIPLEVAPRPGPLPERAERLAAPRAALLAGTASAFPYFAFSALALVRVGVTYRSVDGAAIAAGALEPANLFVLPGGFANWSLDVAERAPGADARVRAFLDAGGAAFGTCGGASYLSAGRPGWMGAVASCPHYTHEYLQSGVAVVSLLVERTSLGIGCPPTLEVPYYHGPVYDVVGEGVEVAARFHGVSFPSRLGIDNPLDPALFDRDFAGRAAILSATGPRGRAIVVSPHPEMGDLVRKYMALDGYVRKYLPVRGRPAMEATLGAYQPLESPSFRLILNAVHDLLGGATPSSPMPAEPVDGARLAGELGALARAVGGTLDALAPHLADDGLDGLLRDLAADLGRRAPLVAAARDALARLDPRDPEARLLASELLALADASVRHLTAETAETRPIPQRLMELELVLSFCEVFRRVADLDRRLVEAGV